MNSKKLLSVKNICLIGMLSALAAVLMWIEFPLPFAPAFYQLDFSEVPVLIGGFAMGPVAAVLIESLKILIKILIKPTSTAYVGEMANLIVGISFVFPSAMYYYKNKTKKGALLGLVFGTISLVIVGGIFNYFVLLPAYSTLFHTPIDVFISMGTEIIPLIKNKFTFVLLATSPFNLFKGIAVSTVVALTYKHISRLIKKF